MRCFLPDRLSNSQLTISGNLPLFARLDKKDLPLAKPARSAAGNAGEPDGRIEGELKG
jgi:hypothetical protein